MSSKKKEQEKTSYSDEELAMFREIIEEKLKNAKEQLEFYTDQLTELAENTDSKIKSLDDGASTSELETLARLASRQEKLIDHLEKAKIRVDNKVYGICRVTGKLIAKERLMAVPHATLSIEAKMSRR